MALTLIGDTDQMMFAWVDAKPEIMLSIFENIFPDNVTVMLDKNFRSTSEIVNRCATLISHNYSSRGGQYDAKYEKAVMSCDDAPTGAPITARWYTDATDEAQAVVYRISELSEQGYTPGDVFVAARTRAQLAFMESPLVRARIPFINLCGGSFWNTKHVAQVVAYLSLAVNGDNESFAKVYDVASKNFKQTFATQSRAKGDYSPNRWLGDKFLSACGGRFDRRHAACGGSTGWRWRAGVDDLDDMVRMIGNALDAGNMVDTLKLIIEHIKANMIAAAGLVEADASENDKDADFDTVLAVAADFPTAKEFLAHVAECQQVAKDESWDGKVVLSTVHRLKGLERKVVFGIGWSEGLLPHKSALGRMVPMGKLPTGFPSRIEDERCIAFVAVSRAKEICEVSGIACWRKDTFEPSRFIAEMGIEIEDCTASKDVTETIAV